MLFEHRRSRLQRLDLPDSRDRGIVVYLKREDELHPLMGGNKWRKLRYNIEYALQHRAGSLITFGGHLSNHLIATAAAGQEYGLKTVGYVRDDADNPSPFTRSAQRLGMRLHFVDTSWFRRDLDAAFRADLAARHPDALIVPEGATNQLGLRGIADMVNEIDVGFTHIACAVGTGGTVAGLVAGLSGGRQVAGYAGWRGAQYLPADVAALLVGWGCPWRNYTLDFDHHLGGFGHTTPELEAFARLLDDRYGVRVDLRFTGKMLFAVAQQISQGYFREGAIIVALHNGLPATIPFPENGGAE